MAAPNSVLLLALVALTAWALVSGQQVGPNVTVDIPGLPANITVGVPGVATVKVGSNITTLLEVLSGEPSLSTLRAAVSACPKAKAAAENATTAATLFAPSNEAFNKALAKFNSTAAQLLANTSKLCSILAYHAVPAIIPSSAATTTPISVPTYLRGANITIQMKSGHVVINGESQVIQADIPAGASLIHVIDKVLFRPSAYKH